MLILVDCCIVTPYASRTWRADLDLARGLLPTVQMARSWARVPFCGKSGHRTLTE
jgi:hypothetical protein